MPVTISSSTYAEAAAQQDGRAWVRQTAVLSNGVPVSRLLLLTADTDRATSLAAFTSTLLDDLATMEIYRNVQLVSTQGSLANGSLTFIYSTVAQNAAAIREVWAIATNLEAVMIADYLNSLSNAVLMAAFGFSLLQVTTLRTNVLLGAASLATSIRNATGQ